jgi:hypothetical protein
MAAVAAAAALYWIVDLALLRAGLPHPLDDLWEDGVVARELIAGHGFRSLVIYPPLWSLRDPSTLTVPVLVHGPLIPVLLVAPLALAGPAFVDHLAWLAAFLAVIAALQVFRLGIRWFGDPSTATVAAALFTLSPITLAAVHHSLSVVIGAGLMLIALEALFRDTPRPLLAGLVLGLAYLVRPEMLLAALILAGFATWSLRPAAGARLVAGFAVAAAAWWVHQWRASGMALFNLSSYGVIGTFGHRPEYTVFRDFDLTPDRWPATLRLELPHLWSKWITFFPRACRHAVTATGWTTGWLAPIGAWCALRDPERRGWALAGTLLALIPLATMTTAVPQKLYLMPFLGLYALAAAWGLASLMTTLRAARPARVWVPALALLLAVSILPTLHRATTEGRQEAALLADERRGLTTLAAATPPSSQLVFTDRPDFVAWTIGRPAVYVSREEYLALYPSAGPPEADRPHGLPRRREPADTWFHQGYWERGEEAR